MQKKILQTLLILALFVCLSYGWKHSPFVARESVSAKRAREQVKDPSKYKSGESQTQYTEAYFNQILDHFNYGFGSDSTLEWRMRYLYNGTYWGGKDNLSPIFVYCGNEGDITGFWNNSGFMVDVLASQYHAYLLFPEHRYFGKSLPYGEQSLDKENLVYLNADQALADFAVFLRYYKTQVLHCPDCPVILFGGSYGGMLASWMRMKYPNMVDGAWAASAPILYFNDVVPQEAFYEIVSWDFGNVTAAPKCGATIKEGFRRMNNWINNAQGTEYQQINQIFDTCTPLTSNKNISAFEDWLTNAYVYMAMVDYPYPTSFLSPLPGYPVDFACQAFIGLDTTSSDKDILTAMLKSSLIFYNYENVTQCNEVFDMNAGLGSLGDQAWNVLACSQVILPMGTNGVNDIFPSRPWDYQANSKFCKDTYGVQSRYDWALNEFGGWDVKKDLVGYSNILFSNGLLDPWHAGGVLVNITDSVTSIIIDRAAHHLDLRNPNPADPPSVVTAREIESQAIAKWIKQKQDRVKKTVQNIEL